MLRTRERQVDLDQRKRCGIVSGVDFHRVRSLQGEFPMTRNRKDDDSSKPESRSLNRRNLLLCGTTLTAACLLCALGTSSLAQQTTGTPGSPGATTTIDGKYLPPPPPKFGGDINLQ